MSLVTGSQKISLETIEDRCKTETNILHLLETLKQIRLIRIKRILKYKQYKNEV